jgi:hypothetical protein
MAHSSTDVDPAASLEDTKTRVRISVPFELLADRKKAAHLAAAENSAPKG